GRDRSAGDHEAVRRRRRGRRRRDRPRIDRWRVSRPARAVRLRQDDAAADDRGPGTADRRRHSHRGAGRHRPATPGPPHRDGLPELRALPPHDRLQQHRLPAPGGEAAEGDAEAEGRLGVRHPRDRSPPRPQTEATLGRSAATGRPCPCPGPGAERLPARRAAVQPGRPTSRLRSRRAAAVPAPGRDDDALRHPRPGGGDGDGRPDRGDGPGPDPPGRNPARDLRRPGRHLRGHLPRLPADEPDPRRRVRPPLRLPPRALRAGLGRHRGRRRPLPVPCPPHGVPGRRATPLRSGRRDAHDCPLPGERGPPDPRRGDLRVRRPEAGPETLRSGDRVAARPDPGDRM
ncbi:MAG: Glycerol-3-phosphate ABC transporter, ATP-binding protein UgpC, partial [uncultured Thermomicrobiales bacterium]